MLIQIKVPKEIGLKQRIVEKYTYLYREYRRFYPMQTILNQDTKPTLVAVLMINGQGMMLTVNGEDFFVSYNRVPWLKEAKVADVLNVQMCSSDAIEWPALDIDLEIDSLRHPEKYPNIMTRYAGEVI